MKGGKWQLLANVADEWAQPYDSIPHYKIIRLKIAGDFKGKVNDNFSTWLSSEYWRYLINYKQTLSKTR